ncbi:DUF454 family protein [Aquifex aeolicus]|uniref:DUF454 family protein n=1 Tax=Aquifex aeolicus TaxID=63363 RepID=UPI0002F8973A|nr:DUF454 family protein [Aquifex aeolicus]
MKFLYVICGVILSIFGIIGLILPIIPSSPFFIPALFCFYKAYPNFVKKVLNSEKVRRFVPKKVLEKLN